MRNDPELQRKILASKERQKAYGWGIGAYVAMGCTGALLLIAGTAGWTFALVPILAIGATVSVFFIVFNFWHGVASFKVRVPDDAADRQPYDGELGKGRLRRKAARGLRRDRPATPGRQSAAPSRSPDRRP
jgi:hypothetical protein